MPCRLLFLSFMLVLSTPLAAEAPQTGPVIEAYGPTVMVGDLDVPLADGFEYRVLTFKTPTWIC